MVNSCFFLFQLCLICLLALTLNEDGSEGRDDEVARFIEADVADLVGDDVTCTDVSRFRGADIVGLVDDDLDFSDDDNWKLEIWNQKTESDDDLDINNNRNNDNCSDSYS